MNVQMARVRKVRAVADQGERSADLRVKQPYLHDLITVVQAPGVALSTSDGQISRGAHGLFWADRRLLSRFAIRAGDHEPVGVQATAVAPGRVRFLGVLRELGDDGPDPSVTVQRDRAIVEAGMTETITMRSAARRAVTTELEVLAASDLTDMAAVKGGHSPVLVPPQVTPDGLQWRGSDGTIVRLRAEPPPTVAADGSLSWPVTLDPGEDFSVTIDVRLDSITPPTVLPASVELASAVAVRGGDHRLSSLVRQGLLDLDSLVLADPLDVRDRFLAAGAPWFLTLFGRDAIWAARMLLPLGTDLAGGTLRALARRQGTVVDVASAQEPGKIMHEIRPSVTNHDGATGDFQLPPLYYGTVDATALWVSLLHDAWRSGLPADQVTELLPTAARAMEWVVANGANGFVSYRDASGHGLANQGWKDSGDSVQFHDGSLAAPPIALCEVQGYAYAAAHHAADLFDAFGRPGGDQWRAWAAELAERFRSAFWVLDDAGDYPAIALDADGKRVDTVTSNIAHLLGTGLLNRREEGRIVERLGRPDMDSGYGLRTMSSTAYGFNPLAYHGGSVWTHDTAIAIMGLAGSDAPAAPSVAASLADGLLAAAPAFDFRLPELFGGHARTDFASAVPYPAACRPQAWSAAASIAVVSSILGLHLDAPSGIVHLRPMRPSPVGAFEVRGLRIGEVAFDVAVDADGDPVVRGLDGDIQVIVA
jgi:glycogen debranching enzyme